MFSPIEKKDLLYENIGVLDEVIDTLERQLSQMSFFTTDTEEMASEKLEYAPLRNSGCESEFVKLNKLKISGGTMNSFRDTFSQEYCINKFIISRSKFHWVVNWREKGSVEMG